MEIVERMGCEQALDQGEDAARVLSHRSKDDDSGVAAGRVAPEVADPTVESERHSALSHGCRDDHWIASTGELFLDHRVHVMAAPFQRRSPVVRKVLVELELHAGNGRISSRASAAPYAAAARTPSTVKVGFGY